MDGEGGLKEAAGEEEDGEDMAEHNGLRNAVSLLRLNFLG